MRLLASLSALVLAGPSLVPLDAQAVLPSRGFDPAPVAMPPPPSTVEWWRNGGPRIRPTDDRVSALLASGLARSGLLRRLVDRVETADVIVYVGMNDSLDKGLAGALTFVGYGGGFRFLKISLNPDLGGDVVIASLAHELHHVTELIDAPDVRSEMALSSLYRRIGRRSGVPTRLGWETEAARQVTDAVRRELSTAAATLAARHQTQAGAPPQ